MNTVVFNEKIDQLFYSKGFFYSYAAGPGKSYRSIEKTEDLKYPIILRQPFFSEIEVGEADSVILHTSLGAVTLKIPYDRVTESFINEILVVIKL